VVLAGVPAVFSPRERILDFQPGGANFRQTLFAVAFQTSP
jgi:hypothetical protein